MKNAPTDRQTGRCETVGEIDAATSFYRGATPDATPRPDTRAWAVRYIERYHLALVAIPPGCKYPTAEGWNQPGNYVVDADEALRHWSDHPRDGIGAVLAPSGLCSLDVDHIAHTRLALAGIGLDLDTLAPDAPTVQGQPDRWRRLFKAPAGLDLSRKILTWPNPDAPRDATARITLFELRAGPIQDCLPPTIHPGTHRPYVWLTPPGDDFPALPPALLELWENWRGYAVGLEAACPWRKPAEPPPANRGDGALPGVIGLFNQAHDIAVLLESYQYKPSGKGRWLAPASQSGLPGVVRLESGRIFSYHGADPLADGHSHDAFDVFRVLAHGGDLKAAIKAAAALLGIEVKPRGAPAGPAEPARAQGAGDAAEAADGGTAKDRWPDPLDKAAYYGLAGEIVQTIAPHTEADPGAILLQLLTAFGSIVGRGPHYRVEGDTHATNLFVVLVGATAKGRKGTSWGRVRQLFEMLALPGAGRLGDSWADDRVQSGLSSGEGLIWAVRDEIRRLDKDGEEVVVDAGVTDKRLLVIESEFASTLRVLAREGNTLSPMMRNAWDTGNLNVLTKNNTAKATGALISVVGHVTADELRRYLDRTEAGNGFANRFLFACVRRSKCLPDGGNLEPDALAPYAARLAVAITTARQTARVTMDDLARTIWHRVYAPLSEPLAGLLGAVTSRAEAQVVRLALLYALLDGAPQIGVVHLRAALAVWDYCEGSTRYVFGSSLGDPTADQILRSLRASPDGLTQNEIRDLFNRHKSADDLGRALEFLRQQGLVKSEKRDTGGRPSTVWCAT